MKTVQRTVFDGQKSSGLYKITIDTTGHVSSVTAVTKADITALGIPAQDTNTTYVDATESASGLFSAANLKKLNGIASGAQVNSITGIKGSAESSYRTGQVNITAANVGTAAASHTHVSTGSVSVPASGWKTDSNAKFPYYYDLSISGIAASDRVDLNVAIASVDTAIVCGLCPLTEAFDGKVRLRAKKCLQQRSAQSIG